MNEGRDYVDVVLAVDSFSAVEGRRPDPLPAYLLEDVSLGQGLFVGPIVGARHDLLAACDARGINHEPITRAYGSDFLIGRRAAPGHRWDFDPDRLLWTCLQLSRLVRPTSIGMGTGGRMEWAPSGELVSFSPSRVDGCAGRGWVADTSINWFVDEELIELQELLEAFDPDTLPERVLQALWHHEHAHGLFFVDVRWPLMATGLEALVHTDRYRSTRQFVSRLYSLQNRLGLTLADEDMLATLYDRRSSLAHGQRLGDLDADTRDQYVVLGRLLREILRRCILEPEVATLFESADTVRSAMPLE